MEPKPVITYSGDSEVFNAVLQKKLQTRLRLLQLSSPNKDDPPYSAFSLICNGVEFVTLATIKARAKSSVLVGHQRPVLHTYWTCCCSLDEYSKHDRPLITQWLSQVEGDGTGSLIVYCITAEVRAKRHRAVLSRSSEMEDRIRNEFKGRADDVVQFRLASSEPARLVESHQTFTSRVNTMCLSKLQRDIEKEEELVARQRKSRTEPDAFYKVFVSKLSLAVAHEMMLNFDPALRLYTEASVDLEQAVSTFHDNETPPTWLTAVMNASCSSWDYPKLLWSQLSWRYLQAIYSGGSPLLHTRTFLLSRMCHLLFALGQAGAVSERCISTLHCLTRESKLLKLSFPLGAFDCWAYMTCNEAVSAITMRISAVSLAVSEEAGLTSASSFLLVRAELWHYSLMKLHNIGVLCGLMPSSNALNFDKELIRQITSGITPVTLDADLEKDVEDQGKKLIEMLNSRQNYHNEYLGLGEMVIGAFKHAGRRRMAFRVGTMLAQFQRDKGLVHEAEGLLSDVSKFYSEDQWAQLSTKAYSLLADCQKRLKLEDKYATTMMLLTSLPAYPGASHDPQVWLERLMIVAERSHYQKILTWEPLLELSKICCHGSVCILGNKIKMELAVRSHAPKALNPMIASVVLRSTSQPKQEDGDHTPDTPISTVSSKHSRNISLTNLEDLDLESDFPSRPQSRPIGGAKARTASNMTHISSSDIDSRRGTERVHKPHEITLLATRVVLEPGITKITVEGEAKPSGCYQPCKVTLKCGALDFVLTLSAEVSEENSISIHPPQVNVNVAVVPQLGVLLSGCSLACVLDFSTGVDTSIPDHAPVRVLVGGASQLCLSGDCEEQRQDKQLIFDLPPLTPDARHTVPMQIMFPPMHACTVARQPYEPQDTHAWKYEMEVYCDWLSPVHVARIPLMVYEPLTVVSREHSAGSSSFLELTLTNTCPVPLALSDHMLAADLELSRLHDNWPEDLFPNESYCCVWQVQEAAPDIHTCTQASLHLKLRPVVAGSNSEARVFKYDFVLSNMQTVFHLRGWVEPAREPLVVKATATLHFEIENVTKAMANISVAGKLRYDVVCDPGQWVLSESDREELGSGHGEISIPKPSGTVLVRAAVVPIAIGNIPIPYLTLSTLDTEADAEGKGLNEKFTLLSCAQVYNTSLGHVTNVIATNPASV